MFGYKIYPNPENFTPSMMVWMVTFSKSALQANCSRLSVWPDLWSQPGCKEPSLDPGVEMGAGGRAGRGRQTGQALGGEHCSAAVHRVSCGNYTAPHLDHLQNAELTGCRTVARSAGGSQE